jgi:two-component system NtrC family response regulator
VIGAKDLGFLGAPGLPAAESTEAGDLLAGKLPEVIEQVERELIRRALQVSGGNRAQAAEQLGIRRQLLYQKLERYGRGLSVYGTAHVPEED